VSSRVASLDGLRAVSILLVIIDHLSTPFFGVSFIAYGGGLGVRIFFVISGLLITSLLLKEWEFSGAISLTKFYARRSLRILPLAYFYIGVIAILTSLKVVSVNPGDFWLSCLYLVSYKAYSVSNVLVHLWSLSVEEQFYLLWPAIFLFSGAKNAGRVALGVVICGPFLRAGWWYLLPNYRLAVGVAFPTIADALAIGCYAALNRELISRWVRRIPTYLSMAAPLVAWFLFVLPSHMQAGAPRQAIRLLSDSAINLLVLIFVITCVDREFRVLNSKLMIYLGTISYSLYIWQQLFVSQSAPSLGGTLIRVIAMFAISILAHYALERPFLRLKEKFSVEAAVKSAHA
jgi:peptidoglycan/LPS O-acetylase OafA/YrhL